LANDMLLTGRKLDALAALKAGLINGVYSMERFDDEMTDLIRSLLALPPGAMAASKALLHGFGKASVHQVISEELAVFAQCLAGDECRSIFKALAAKRHKGG